MKLKFGACALAMLVFLSSHLAAAESVSGTVILIGNHNVDNVCYVVLSNPTPISTCNHDSSVRWDCGTEWGQRWYANMLTARVTGLTVSVHIKEGECSAQGYPTFDYGSL